MASWRSRSPRDRVPHVLEAEDRAAGREVGAVDDLAQLVDGHLRVVDEADDRVADLVEVVWRDVRRHPHRDARRPVEEQVRQPGGKDERLAQTAVVVVDEVDGLLLDVREHLVGDRHEPRLGVAHGCRRVAVDRAEVALAVDERVAQAEVLCQADERFVQGQVAMRVVLGHRLADHAGALAVRGRGAQAHVEHRVEDSPMDRLEAVANVRQGARDDDAHRVVDVRGAHLVLDRYPADRRRGWSMVIGLSLYLFDHAVAFVVPTGATRRARRRQLDRHARSAASGRRFWVGLAPRNRPLASAMVRPSCPRTSPWTA